jgi:DNA-binding winged helix-turn-helix (wHTH) protein/TolB-like protein
VEKNISNRRVRFGIFEFDTVTLELYRNGTPVNLQAQPAKVLAVLLEHDGGVVTREALQSAVWKTDTHVDFDRGLNFCIAQIRAALGDSAESPRFLRTLPKRGYQFIAPIERLQAPEPAVDPAQALPLPASPRARRSVPWGIVPIGGILLAVAAGYVAFRSNALPFFSPPPPVKIAVALFDNETGRTELDSFVKGLTDHVVAQLTMSGLNRYLVIGNASVLRVPPEQRDLNTIASTLAASYIVLGQLQRSGDRVRVLAHLIRMPDQTHVWVTRMERSLEDPLKLQSDLARQIVDEFNSKLPGAVSPSASHQAGTH